MANVSLRHIYKIYDGGVTAVTDFNLEIAGSGVYHICRTFRMWKIHNTSYDRRS
mgnify:CR=1 FL=1